MRPPHPFALSVVVALVVIGALITLLLRTRRGGAAPLPRGEVPLSPALLPVEEEYDLGGLRRIVGEEGMAVGLALLIDGCDNALARLGDAVARREGEAIRRAAHTLKGNLLQAGARGLAGQARALEGLGREGRGNEAELPFARLREGYGRLRERLRPEG